MKKKTVSCIRNCRKQQNTKSSCINKLSLYVFHVLDTVADYNRIIVYNI